MATNGCECAECKTPPADKIAALGRLYDQAWSDAIDACQALLRKYAEGQTLAKAIETLRRKVPPSHHVLMPSDPTPQCIDTGEGCLRSGCRYPQCQKVPR